MLRNSMSGCETEGHHHQNHTVSLGAAAAMGGATMRSSGGGADPYELNGEMLVNRSF